MLLQRRYLTPALDTIAKLDNEVFNINTQYKLIKIKKKLLEEQEIYQEQLDSLKAFFETDESGNYIMSNDGGYKIKSEFKELCFKKLEEINHLKVQVPDIYFSLEELEPFNLTLKNLESLEPFIRT